MTIQVEREYQLKCQDCDFTAESGDYAAALDAAKDHLHVDTIEEGMRNYHHGVEIREVNIVRDRW